MSEKLLNCWEVMKCGREAGGKMAAEEGVCPAARDTSFDGINRGKNAGRICWAVAGTFCGGEVQGSFADKRKSCITCRFYNHVASETDASDNVNFLKYVSADAKTTFLDRLTFKMVKGGERFIRQGENGDNAYIIQRGSCLTIVEKDGVLHPVGHRGVGDIVGLTSFLTGELQQAHVEAEMDVGLWVLDREKFEDISKDDPEMVNFLTELVADRFDTKRPVPDRTIGKYVASDIIGSGGYSIVYRGIHKGLNKPVVIKMMRHNLALNPEFLEKFRGEARIIAALDHENIIDVFDVEERFRTVFIIMEYVDGEILRAMMTRLKIIPPALAAGYLVQICMGLNYAHLKGIVHRDINPLNIIITRDDHVKILDFGLACPPGTDDFMFGGQIAYQAPEMIDGSPPTPMTDIYALGVMAFEMVTGRKPFEETDAGKLIKRIRTEEIPDPSDFVPDLPAPLGIFIRNSCSHNPEERYQNAAQAMEAISGLVRRGGGKRNVSPVRKMTPIYMIHSEAHQMALIRLLEKFGEDARELGIDIRIGETQEI